jgi:hypothetical protein
VRRDLLGGLCITFCSGIDEINEVFLVDALGIFARQDDFQHNLVLLPFSLLNARFEAM